MATALQSVESSSSVFTRKPVQARRRMQTWRWLAVAAIVTVAVDGILLLINSVVSAGKPFDTNQFFVLFQTLIALLAWGCLFWASLSQSNTLTQIASDSADDGFYRTIGSMVVIGRQVVRIIEDSPRHYPQEWRCRLAADLLLQMRTGTLLSFPDEHSLEATLVVIRIGEELICHYKDCSMNAVDEFEGQPFRQRSLMLNTLKTAISELAALGAAWNINIQTERRTSRG
ncbi:hypothetical protein [Achromobacter xylosoxidans]|uniref:hypothetical protein n=1 Tax=Alcaligenes xylosoxydans xylosoxydans TaxID=85698 RepID=UPI0006C4F032|nr:hypothetical protein [Achromobacter xylosoxidans]CUJ40098.1 Uncharacterised protein [Achromobacter xylosoxidans]